ncbi:MAG: NAD(P)-dependent glycerol-3-phosphate dehydrogenase [Roseibium sp.]|nr:NAD(P)-dependent glycerol-3-phosphate dehydrogenase [Roseibium sp.]
MSGIARIGVLGAGAWGTALALTAARAGQTVILWGRDTGSISEIRARKQNSRYLPGITFDEDLDATTDLSAALNTDAVLLVTPAQTTREMCTAIAGAGGFDGPIILCAKGIERGTGKLLSDIIRDVLPEANIAALSGPSFALDVARGLPTAVTIAAPSEALASGLCTALAAPAFRPYASTDIVGVQVGGALKNVLAIASGAVVGRKLGASAQAALIARGFAELTRIGAAMTARPETLTGLSGLGDLVLTCSSAQSRNFSFGVRLGEGASAAELADSGQKLVEGVFTARIAVRIARDLGIELPICQTVAAMIDDGLSIDGALNALMARPLAHESAP